MRSPDSAPLRLRLVVPTREPHRMAENNNGAFLWSIANLLRGVYKQADYGKVILPFTVLRRLDALLEPTKDAVLETFDRRKSQPGLDHVLPTVSKQAFYNTS